MKFNNIINKLDTFSDKVFGYTENCNSCNNKHTCMCDTCSSQKNLIFKNKYTENHHTDNYLDINFEPKFLEFDFEDNMKSRRR